MQFLLSNHSPTSDLTAPELMGKDKTAQPFLTSFSEMKPIYALRELQDLAKSAAMAQDFLEDSYYLDRAKLKATRVAATYSTLHAQWLLLLQPWETPLPVEVEDPFKDQRWQSPHHLPTSHLHIPRLTIGIPHLRTALAHRLQTDTRYYSSFSL